MSQKKHKQKESIKHTVIYWYAKNGTQDQVDKQFGKVISLSSHINLKSMKMDLMNKQGDCIMKEIVVDNKPTKQFVEVPLSSKRIMDLALAVKKLNWMKLPKGVTYAGVLDEDTKTLKIGRMQTFGGRRSGGGTDFDWSPGIPPDTFIKEEGRKRAVGRALTNPCIVIKYDNKTGLGRAFAEACQQFEVNEAKKETAIHVHLKFEKGELELDFVTALNSKQGWEVNSEKAFGDIDIKSVTATVDDKEVFKLEK